MVNRYTPRCKASNYPPSVVFTPFRQVLKSRIQSAPSGTYSGFFDCFRKTVAHDGFAALWKGLGPAMARVCHFHDYVRTSLDILFLQAFPANAATFVSSVLQTDFLTVL